MTRLATFVLFFTVGCATIPAAPPPVPSSCDKFVTELEKVTCQRDRAVALLEKERQTPPRRQATGPATVSVPAGTMLPPGYVPVMQQRIFVTTDIPSMGEGIAVRHLQNGTYPIVDPTLVACAWSDSGYLEVQGSGRIGVYLDESGGTKPGVLGIPKFCARASSALAFHNVPRGGRVRVLYAQATTNTVGGYPVYRVAHDKTYVRRQRNGFTSYTGIDGY